MGATVHDTLAKVVSREAAKLLKASEADEILLSESSLEALEILARCAKALKADPLPDDGSKMPGDGTTDAELRLVDGT